MPEKNPPVKPSENRESALLVEHAFDLARKLEIQTLLVLAEAVSDQRRVARHQENEKVVWLAREDNTPDLDPQKHQFFIRLPEEKLSRSDQFQIGLLLAVLQGQVAVDETVLCLTGLAGSRRLDNLLITNLKRDNPWFHKRIFKDVPSRVLQSQEFFRLLDIALRFSQEGREGKAIGTTFILGDMSTLEPFLTPLILNPLEGHPARQRSIHQNDIVETLRELAALDGAFIINTRGTVERAATYLNVNADRRRIKVPAGCGARHTSAAALTLKTDALAIVVSESAGSVTAFYNGGPILEIGQ